MAKNFRRSGTGRRTSLIARWQREITSVASIDSTDPYSFRARTLTTPPSCYGGTADFCFSDVAPRDQGKIVVGARFVEEEAYVDSPGGSRAHTWRLRFPWPPLPVEGA